MGMSNKQVIMLFSILAVVVVGGVVGGLYLLMGAQEGAVVGPGGEELAPGEQAFSSFEVSFQTRAIDSDAQDDEDDVNIEIYEWDSSKNAELVSKGYLDCSGATPAVFDGDNVYVEVTDANLCNINAYKAWQSWTAGSWESDIGDYLQITKDDVGDADADDSPAGGTANIKLSTAKTYLITGGESATTDDEDVIPFAFLVTSDGSTTLDPETFHEGSTDVVIEFSYYSEAGAHSKLSFSGEYEDDEDNSGDLSSNWAGGIDSSLTTATTIKLDADLNIEVKEDGYMFILQNDLASSDSERPYLVVTPYGECDNGTSELWIEYGTGDLTGDVGYNAADSLADQIIWEGSSACGVTLTTSSGTDAVTNGDENLYEPPCFVSAASEVFGQKGIADDGDKLVIAVHIDEVKVDYDLATAGTDETVSAASGSSPEAFFDIDCFSIESGTDRCARTFAG